MRFFLLCSQNKYLMKKGMKLLFLRKKGLFSFQNHYNDNVVEQSVVHYTYLFLYHYRQMEDFKKEIITCIYQWRNSIEAMLEASDTQADRVYLLRTLADLAEEFYIKLRFDWCVELTQKWRDFIDC